MQAFGQGSLAHETAEGGTGLGLAIVKNLIELHGGSLILKSELRKGTEARVVLPGYRVLRAMAAAAAARPGDPSPKGVAPRPPRPARLRAGKRKRGSSDTAAHR